MAFSSDQEFIDKWNDAPSAEYIAKLFGYKNADTARHRAVRLRKKGHYLKNMRCDFDIAPMIEVAKGNYEISPEMFIILWQNCSSAKQVAEVTGLTYAAVRARAREYRKMGIPIQKRTRGRKPHD